MIIIINGPLGIGKTQTSWALVRRFPRAVMLDADYVAEFHPFDYYNDEHLAYAHATLRVLAAHHISHGFQHFVINWIFETPFQLDRLKRGRKDATQAALDGLLHQSLEAGKHRADSILTLALRGHAPALTARNALNSL